MSRRGLLAAATVIVLVGLIGGALALNGESNGADADGSTSTAADAVTTTATSPTASSTQATSPATSPETAAPPSTTRPPETTTTSAEGLPEAGSGSGETTEQPVPMGEAITVGNWHIGVLSVELDANETILDHVEFNEEPDPGNQYVLVRLTGVNVGAELAEPAFDFAVVNGEFTKTPGDHDCGLVPENVLELAPITAGNDFEANVCFEVPTSEVNDDLLFTLGVIDDEGAQRFFALSG